MTSQSCSWEPEDFQSRSSQADPWDLRWVAFLAREIGSAFGEMRGHCSRIARVLKILKTICTSVLHQGRHRGASGAAGSNLR